MTKGRFTLRDLYKQLSSTMKLGSMSKVMGMIPGMGEMAQVCDTLFEHVHIRHDDDRSCLTSEQNPRAFHVINAKAIAR